MKHHLLNTLFAPSRSEFSEELYELLLSRGFERYTIWDVENGLICRPLKNSGSFDEATFDIYDLGYTGSEIADTELTLSYFDISGKIFHSFFCVVSNKVFYAVTFEKPLSDEKKSWFSALLPFLSDHVGNIVKKERDMGLFVDYQRKIDFIKACGQILKLLEVKDVLVNALYFFSETFRAEAGCAFYGDFFEGFGIDREEMEKEVLINDLNISDFVAQNPETLYMDNGISSGKFAVSNIFIIRDYLSGAYFILFNTMADVIPDKEFSVLISNIVAIAIENAQYHKRITDFMVESAEMSQTVAILNQFVSHKTKLQIPELYCVNYPAKSAGGDFSTVIDKDDYLFVCIADVCGKGYVAAVFTVMLATLIDSGVISDLRNISNITNSINRYLLSRSFEDRFITGFFMILDKRTLTMNYISCGHEPVFLIENGRSTRLNSKNMPLGILPEEYEENVVELKGNEVIFIYTDGLVEYISYDDLENKVISMASKSAEDIVNMLYGELVTEPDFQKDDFTCVALKV
jgi:serine phosphatase RsbU (regulator of sigma subunit)